MNPILKRYVISSLTTFLTTFFGSLSLQIGAGAFTAGTVTVSLILSILAIAGRAAVKAVIEAIAGQHADA
jgi:hypothetical protein